MDGDGGGDQRRWLGKEEGASGRRIWGAVFSFLTGGWWKRAALLLRANRGGSSLLRSGVCRPIYGHEPGTCC